MGGGGGVAYGKRVAAEPIAPGACMEYPLQKEQLENGK